MATPRTLARSAALPLLAVPSLARAEIINPGTLMSEYLASAWGLAAMLAVGWPALHTITARTWARSIWPTVAVKLPTALLGPVLLFFTGGFVINYEPLGLAANVLSSSIMYTLIDLSALWLFLKFKPSRRGSAALLATNLLLISAAMILFVTLDRQLWIQLRSMP